MCFFPTVSTTFLFSGVDCLSLESEDDSNQFRMMYQETPGETGEI